MMALIRSVLLPNLNLQGFSYVIIIKGTKDICYEVGGRENSYMSRTSPCLDQGVMVFCKTRTMGNEGLLQGPMLCSSKGFLQEVGIILKLCGTFRFQRHGHSSKSDLIWP